MKRFLVSIAIMAGITTAYAQKKLVLYFSETGTTKTVALELQKQLGADIEAIQPEEPYSGNFQETVQRAQREKQSGTGSHDGRQGQAEAGETDPRRRRGDHRACL